MNVSGVNQIAFAGKPSVTKEGNEYKKTHMGLKTGVIIGAGGALSTMIAGASREGFKSGLKEFFGAFKSFKNGSKILLSMAIPAVVLGGIGVIHDAIVNKKIRKNVDNAVAKSKDIV